MSSSQVYKTPCWVYTQKKRVPKQYPSGTIATNSHCDPFLEGHSFFLNNHVYPKKSAPKQKGTIFQKSATRGTVLQNSKRGTILVPLHW